MAQERWSDRQILEILHRVEVNRESSTVIAADLGVGRGAILGIVKRVRDDLAESEVAGFAPGTGPAVRVGNRDGDLPPRWWAARAPSVPIAPVVRVAAR